MTSPEKTFKILPAIKVTFENSELWLETYKPSGWTPLKTVDYHNITDEHIEEIDKAVALLKEKVSVVRKFGL